MSNEAEHNWNQGIIQEFRANEGKVGGPFEGASMLLLHTKGAKSGEVRINPLGYYAEGEGQWCIIASNSGYPNHPGWYYNLLANPQASIEVGTESIDVKASLASKSERDRIYALVAAVYPVFTTYEEKAKGIREIQVFGLTRASK